MNDNVDVGFAHCHIRHDYVKGTVTKPHDFLEAHFVKDEHRSFGIGNKMKCK
jgi:aminoglycoside 6'-N-acetyltransferase I